MIYNIIWYIIELFSKQRGYSTQVQRRFKNGQRVIINNFVSSYHKANLNIGDEVKIIESARHDYLIVNEDGEKAIVYQFELREKTKYDK